ncbi:hypothetical protein AMS68_002296 [Peltaster fructicola]|uniref:RRM domain-containing protein n=1 Tax=Peltaster fructicola TaxID=286661 RepID=A0A6H0XQ87_9PEZI|nr:hypothetical protein AMS68_002296 [Peltaster fructicola]
MALEQRMPPAQSLYIQNLPQQLHKEDLRRALYMLFSTHGSVLDVTAMKTRRMRGQAHVLFRDVQTATQAMRACQGFDFFGREMRISYAKARSHTLQKMTGVFEVAPPAEEQAASNTFPPPPGATTSIALPGPPPGLPTGPVDFPKAPTVSNLAAPPSIPQGAPSPQGVKRAREESDEEVSMDEDDDGEGEMDMSDDD